MNSRSYEAKKSSNFKEKKVTIETQQNTEWNIEPVLRKEYSRCSNFKKE